MLVEIIRLYGQCSLRADFMDEYIGEELQAAREAVSDAEKMHEGEVTDNAIVNRLYYACFHAAQAALAHRRMFRSRRIGDWYRCSVRNS